MVKCTCIDNKKKPSEIPMSHWINEGTSYTIKHVYNMIPPGNGKPMVGVTLKEVDLESLNIVYKGYKIGRFSVKEEDLEKLIELMKLCSELNDFNPMELLEEQLELVES